MSSRPQFSPHPVVIDGDMSGDIISEPTIVQKLSMVSYDISWSGGSTPIGVMSVEVSNSYSQNADGSVRNAGNWQPLPISGANVSGNSGSGLIEILANSTYAMRLVYTRTSGSGTMQAIVSGKVA